MSGTHDLWIRGGTIVDGTGAPAFEGDVLIDAGRIVEVRAGGIDAATARETIDARGLLVTPGFVDVHTHYDGQATWDEEREVTVRDDEATGARPGRLIRGAR